MALVILGMGCSGSKSRASMTSHELFLEGKKKYEKKKYYPAQEIFQSVVYNYPGNAIVDTAQYYLALSYFGNGEYEVAEVEFNRLAVNYPSSAYHENAVFMRAVSSFEATPDHYALDQTGLNTAIRQFEDFILDYPESELIDDARKYLDTTHFRLARKVYENAIIYSRMGTYTAAKEYFQNVIDNFTDTEYGPKASFKYAEMDFKRKEFDDARMGFENFRTVFPDHEWTPKAWEYTVKAAFRSGEKAFKTGEFEVAREKLIAFIEEFPEEGEVEKAQKYLEKIDNVLADSTRVEDGDS